MNRDEGMLDMRWSSIDFKFHDFMRVSAGVSYTIERTSYFLKKQISSQNVLQIILLITQILRRKIHITFVSFLYNYGNC